MADIWKIIFDIIQMAIDGMRVIPVFSYNGEIVVSLYHFNIGILVITIVSLAFVSVVRVAPSGAFSEVERSRSAAERKANREEFNQMYRDRTNAIRSRRK